jgi:capsular polysaccharide transport system permease protein
VNDYMVSRDALAALNRNNAFEAAYGSGQGDFLSRFGVLPRQRAFEDLLRYFRNRVLVQYDSDTGITTLEVHAFSPADSRKINEQLLELGEHRVNEMNSRAKQDLISYAQQEVERSEVSLQKASAALSAFRDEQAIFDPERQSTLALQNVLQIQEELMASKLQLAQLKSIAPNNPQIPALNVRISTLQNEVDKASSEVTGGRNSLAFKSPAYERLELNRQFADRQLTTALASLETARSDAQRQQLYLDRISQPNLPDKAMLPYRLRNILATIVLGLLVWGTLNLLIASIREHRD